MRPGLLRRSSADPALRSRWLILCSVAALVLVLDQISKIWVLHALGPLPGSRQLFVYSDWISLVYVRNIGIAFGLFQNLAGFFTLVSLFISAGLIYAYLFYLPNQSIWVKLSIGLILGGALGNVLDRLRLQYVVDFIKIGWWPTFNLADSAITLGVLMLAGYLLVGTIDTPVERPGDDERLLRELLAYEPVGFREDHERE